MLDGEGYRVGSLTPDDVERGFLGGLRTIVSARGV
jgi:hypothetical protein